MKAPQLRNPAEVKRAAEAVCVVLGIEHTASQYYISAMLNGPMDVGWGIYQAQLDHDWEYNFTPEQRAAIAALYRLSN